MEIARHSPHGNAMTRGRGSLPGTNLTSQMKRKVRFTEPKEEVIAIRRLMLAGLLLLILGAAVQTIAAQEVTIPSPSHTKAGGKLQVPGILHKPGGDGPFPALVFLVGCEGNTHPAPPLAKQHAQWVDRLVGWGYVTLELDSFTPRDRDSCDKAGTVSEDMRALDAYAAKSYLSTLPFVDPNNVGVIGWSHGGQTILTIIDASSGPRLMNNLVSPFKAAVAFYPYCHSLSNRGI